MARTTNKQKKNQRPKAGYHGCVYDANVGKRHRKHQRRKTRHTWHYSTSKMLEWGGDHRPLKYNEMTWGAEETVADQDAVETYNRMFGILGLYQETVEYDDIAADENQHQSYDPFWDLDHDMSYDPFIWDDDPHGFVDTLDDDPFYYANMDYGDPEPIADWEADILGIPRHGESEIDRLSRLRREKAVELELKRIEARKAQEAKRITLPKHLRTPECNGRERLSYGYLRSER